jgi:hypothetical protein
MRIRRFIGLVLAAVFCALIFAPVMPGSTRAASLVTKSAVVAGSFTESAVTFISQSAFVLPAESVQWVLSDKDCALTEAANTCEGVEGHR